MPLTHGDPSLPFYELPAGNLMPHIIPNKAIPMRADSIRPLQFAAGPADKSLANAVRDFLKDIESIDKEYDLLDTTTITPEFDEMGQISYRNEAGDVLGDTYYGWSRAFCEKMKARCRTGTNGNAKSVSQSSSMSRSQSRSPRKRRRCSDSNSQRSRSDTSYSRSGSRSRPTRIRKGSASRSRPNSPPPARRPQFVPQANTAPQLSSTSPSHYQPSTGLMAGPSHFPPPMPQPFQPPPFGAAGMLVRPPRPPNWTGPWPPPPPPPPGSRAFLPPPPSFGRQTGGPPPGPRDGYHQYR